MILETTFLIDLFRGKDNATTKIRELEKKGVPIFSTSISVFEIIQGLKNPKEEAIAKEFFDSMTILTLDKNSAFLAGEIQKKLREKGQLIDPEDAMIAGISIANDKTLLTNNIKHFSRIKELKSQPY